jgi:hypothetical protein
MINNIVKGDNINLEASLNQNITDWKVRCEIYDNCNHRIKLATENSGGADEQINITDAITGKFVVYVPKDATKEFEDKAQIEIEVENTNDEVYTVYQDEINFKQQKIDWTSPNA